MDATGTFTERIRRHEVAAGRPSRAVPLAELVAGRDITTITARAAIDPAVRTVRLDNGTVLGYRTQTGGWPSVSCPSTGPAQAF